MANNNDNDDLSREMEEQGIPGLQEELQAAELDEINRQMEAQGIDAAIDEMNNAGLMLGEEDVVNDDMSDMTGQDENSVRGGGDNESVALSVASRRSIRSVKSASSSSRQKKNRSVKTKRTGQPNAGQFVMVDGMKIPIENKVIDLTQEAEAPSYPLSDRLKMKSKTEIEDLRDKATKGNRIKFTVFNPTEKSNDILQETTSLESNISDLEAHLVKFDMTGVFNIKKYDPKNPHNVKTIGNLLRDYATITVDQIRKSNLWYSQQPKGEHKRVFKENLDWSESYLDNSMSNNLRARIVDKYRKFNSAQRGGPLLFKLMMDELVINTRDVADHLVNKLEGYDLSKVKGEDVTELTKIVRASVKRLDNMKDPTSGTSYLPKDLAEKLLDILQTSSVPVFNTRFKTRKDIAEARYGPGDPDYGQVDAILKQAEKEYAALVQTGEWHGTNPKDEQHKSTFTANQRGNQRQRNGGRRNQDDDWKSKQTCWNCGKRGHIDPDCNEPRDEARVARNKKKWLQDKKKKGKSSKSKTGTTNSEKNGSQKGIWIPPSAHEAKYGNKRLILGEVRVYDAATKRWNIEKPQAATPATRNATGNRNSQRTTTSNQSGNAANAQPTMDLNAEKEALIDMHLAQFKSSMRSVFGT